MTTVAFIGLGAMGAPMAGNLQQAGFSLRVFNGRPPGRNRSRPRGAAVCTSAGDAARGAQFVVSMVADDDATREVMLGPAGVVAVCAPGTVIVDSSTNTPSMAREVHAAARARGCDYLDAPVSGSLAQARGRELVFMAAARPRCSMRRGACWRRWAAWFATWARAGPAQRSS